MRTKFKLSLLLVMFLISCEILASSQYDWKMVRNEDGIQVYLKEIWADPVKSSMVRVKHSHGHYLLEPVANSITRVTCTQHTNPGGNIPMWLVNQLIQEMPYRTLQGLRKEVFNHKYQKAKLVIDAQGSITDIAGIE